MSEAYNENVREMLRDAARDLAKQTKEAKERLNVSDQTADVCPHCGAEKETPRWYRCGSGVDGHREYECLVREPIWIELRTLRTANATLVERMKRLEEAGNPMADWLRNPRNVGSDHVLSSRWDEAKGQP